MPDYAIRTATDSDKDAVGALLKASYPVLFHSWYDDDALAAALPQMTRANPRLLASQKFFAAETLDYLIVGCGGWSRERPGSGAVEDGLGHIRHFATHPGWLRRGIGRALLERCIADAAAQGVTRFECYSSLPAERFYRSQGFVPVETVEVALGNGVRLPSVTMRYAL